MLTYGTHTAPQFIFIFLLGKQPPLDHTVKIYIARTLSVSVIAVMWSFACFGLLISCFFLYFNIKYKENRFASFIASLIHRFIDSLIHRLIALQCQCAGNTLLCSSEALNVFTRPFVMKCI